jgi:hypothetical protein
MSLENSIIENTTALKDLTVLMEEFIKNGGQKGSQNGGTSVSVGRFSKKMRSDYMDIDDFEKMKEEMAKDINGEEHLTALDEYLEKKEKLNELAEKEKELEEEVKATLAKKMALLEAQEAGELNEEEAEELERLISLGEEYNETYAKRLRLQKDLEGQSTFKSIAKDVNTAIGCVGNLINSMKGVKDLLINLINPYGKINEAASKYAKVIGLTSAGMEVYEKQLMSFAEGSKMIESYNISPEEAAKMHTSYAQSTGKAMRMSNEDFEHSAAARLVVGEGKFVDLASKLENFGLSATDTAQKLGKMHAEAAKNGLSFEAYSRNVADNIKMAQNYTFKNGIKGLESMAKKATAMKLDMQQVANLANQVSNVEGAIQTSAKLQVLGGPFAQLADPMGMLNEGLNDMEGLQDRIIKMIGGLGQFNKETGEVQVSTFNRLRIQEAAKAMGMDPSALMESVHAQGKRNEISKHIESSAAAGFDDDLKELIKNTGTFKDGKAGISVRGQFTALEDLDPEKAEEIRGQLMKETQNESEDIKDIAYGLRSVNDKLEGFSKLWTALKANIFKPIADMLIPIVEWFGEHKTLLKVLIGIAAAIGVSNAIGSLFNSGKNLFKMGKKVTKFGKKLFTRGGAKTAANAIKAAPKMSIPQGTGPFKPTAVNLKGIDPKTLRWAGPVGNSNVAAAASRGNIFQRGWAATKNFGGKITTKLGGAGKFFKGIGSKGAGKFLKTIGTKGAGKVLGIGARLGKAAAAGGGFASIGTVLGEVGDIATDALVANGKIKKGGAAHHALSAGSNALSGAAMGAAIGSIIPGIGTAIGAAVGGVAGAVKGLWKSGAIKQAYKGVKNFLGLGSSKPKKPKAKINTLKGKGVDLLNRYVGKVKPVLDKSAVNTAAQVAKTNNDVHVTSDPYDIKLNGTLNLKGENGQTIDLMNELRNDPTMKRQLSEMIRTEIGVIGKGGYVAQGV